MAEEITRTYTVPLRQGFSETPRYKRTNKAMRVLKGFIVKHMKSENIKIGKKLNELIWQNGIKNPPGKVKVTATKDKEGVVKVELEGVKYLDFKVQEKVDKNQSFKEKLQNKVQTTKDDSKTEEKPVKAKAETKVDKPATVEKKPLAPAKKAEVPKAAPVPKAKSAAEKPKEAPKKVEEKPTEKKA